MAPRFLRRDQAAEYVGVSPDVFTWEVAQGWWPPPVRRGAKGGLDTWDRLALDDRADIVSGRREALPESAAEAAQQAAAEAAAIEGAKRAATQRPGPKPRPPQAR
ncbi:DNA-binding protein [Paracraurococcus ruber]|uniref:Uncharacterized protein n=1 Tax=Paracraurococcus ruber TaxID=77675 RepID=A0ABS1CR07_9PROT|nr:hypothetical protein [Paracraurococcus ruber]TDG34033.1 DNA-binding protein [Paracraurococcus ruber]